MPDPANRVDAPTPGSLLPPSTSSCWWPFGLRVVPVEPPLLLGYGGHLLLHMLYYLAQGLGGLGGADGCALLPGDNERIDEAQQVKNHHHHLFCPAGVNPRLQGA